MGAGTLEARLTRWMLGLAGVVLVSVGATAAIVADRGLDASDTASCRGSAAAAAGAIERELDEGDPVEQVVDEVTRDDRAQGVRLAVLRPANAARVGVGIPDLPEGFCTTVDDHGAPWRVCGAASPRAAVVAAVPIGEHRSLARNLTRAIALAVALGLAALWVAVRTAVRGSLRELTALVGWTGRIVESEAAVPPPRAETREVAQLEAAFDTLVRRLLDALARERANSAHIAHELRTPLTAMSAELEALTLPDDAGRDAVRRVRADVVRLADVIEAILVLSDTRRRSAGRSVVNVADVARAGLPEGARVEAPDEALVEGDERLVALALRNLVENAAKYGVGVELVSVTRDGDMVRLAVLDRGPGVPKETRERMFERYWRGTADGEGKGLGLALVRAVSELHGGRARAEPGPAGGLEVSLTLGKTVGWHDGG